MSEISIAEQMTDFILYTSWSGDVRVQVFLQNETLWLNQKGLAELFATSKQNIWIHLKNIFISWELKEEAVVKEFFTTAWDNKNYKINYYNLDAIIAVWYRVNSSKATQFRIWATNTLKEFIIKWFVMDDERMKNGASFWKDYFKELLERVRSIRASERRIYLQITDIFSECSIDYDKDSQITRDFYATVQNKFHFAITWKTAAEIVFDNADSSKQNMWLTTFKNSPEWRILKSDTTVAKNYLDEKKIKKLERTISSYFDYIENQIENHKQFSMQELSDSVNKFLDFNDFKVLDWKWKISQTQAQQKAFWEYNEFNKTQVINSDFEKMIREKNK